MEANYVFLCAPRILIFMVILIVDFVKVNVQIIIIDTQLIELVFLHVIRRVYLCIIIHVLNFAHTDFMLMHQVYVWLLAHLVLMVRTQQQLVWEHVLLDMLKEVCVLLNVMMVFLDKIKYVKILVLLQIEHRIRLIYVFQCVKLVRIY